VIVKARNKSHKIAPNSLDFRSARSVTVPHQSLLWLNPLPPR